jgi:hypothetical protein
MGNRLTPEAVKYTKDYLDRTLTPSVNMAKASGEEKK